MATVNLKTLMKATGSNESDAKIFLSPINAAMRKYSINTKERILAFLSQIGHESAKLRATKEYATGDAYEGRSDLGNTQTGDGRKFVGRGLIQITGRSNYQQVSKALGKDFVNNPSLLEQPRYAAEASAWWWKNRGLNEIADTMNIKKPLSDPINKSAFERITKIINGGYRGLEDRKDNWQTGKDAVVKFVRQHPVATGFGILTLGLGITATIYYFANRREIGNLKLAA